MKKPKASDILPQQETDGMGLLKAKPEPPSGKVTAESGQKRKFKPPFRMSGMTLITALLLCLIFFLAKQQIGILAFKACLMSMAAVIGYAIDRTLFPDSRPHCFDPDHRWRAEWRRAGIVAATLLTAGLGA